MADPGSIAVTIAIQLAIALLTAALAPKPRLEGPRLQDRKLTSSAYGNEIPLCFGTAQLGGNVIWGLDIEEVATTVSIGKGSPFDKGSQTSYEYFATFAVAFSRSQAKSLTRLYGDGKLIYAADSPADVAISEGVVFNFYRGTETQEPDPLIEADIGVGQTPAYRGICYVVFNRLPLKDFGNRIPSIRAVISFDEAGDQWSDKVLKDPKAEDDDARTFRGSAVYDRQRQVVYTGLLRDRLAAISVRTGEVLAARDTAAIWGDVGATVADTRPWTLTGSRGPYLVFSENDFSRWYRSIIVDKRTLGGVGVIGQNLNTTAPTALGGYDPSGPTEIIEVLALDGSFVYFAVGGSIGTGALKQEGDLWVFGLSDQVRGHAGGISVGEFAGGVVGIVQGRQGVGATEFYVLTRRNDSGSAALNISRFELWSTPQFPEVLLEGAYAYYKPDFQKEAWEFPDNVVTQRDHGDHVNCWFDPVTGALAVEKSGGIAAVDTNDGMVELWRKGTSDSQDSEFAYDSQQYAPVNSRIIPERDYTGQTDNVVNIVDIRTGEVVETRDLSTGFASAAHNPNALRITDLRRRRIIQPRATTDDEEPGVVGYLDQGLPGAADLAEVVQTLVTQGRLSAADVDVTALTGTAVRGYVVERSTTIRGALESLAAAYSFDVTESDGKLVFLGRDAVADWNVGEDDLLRTGQQNLVEEARRGEEGAPTAVYLSYFSVTADYGYGIATHVARRITEPESVVGATSEVTVELPIYLTADEAAEAAERLLLEAWIEREAVTFRLAQQYLGVVPNDVLALTVDGRTDTIRAKRITLGADLTVEVEAVLAEDQTYQSVGFTGAVEPLGSPGYSNTLPRVQAEAVTFLLDVPLLRDGDLGVGRTSGLFYYAAGPAIGYTLDDFTSAYLVTSQNSADWRSRAVVNGGSPYGPVVGDVPDIPGTDWDSVQEASITVRLVAGEELLSSATEAAMIGDDVNRAALYRPNGEVEVIGFRDVEENDDGTFTLTGLLRGQRGTESFASDYSGLVYFILLDEARLTAYAEPTSLFGATVQWRGGGAGTPVDEALQFDVAYQHRSLRPYAPAQVTMTVDDPSSDNRTISWERRTRFNGGLIDGSDSPPLNEESEAYEVDVLDGPGGEVVRTLSTNSPSVVYTGEQADVDFGTAFPNPLHVRVYQVSAEVGRGFTNEVALTEE